ncbi:MAG: hypothetical protein NVSMB52_14530 [Chloroflexota bacterium]
MSPEVPILKELTNRMVNSPGVGAAPLREERLLRLVFLSANSVAVDSAAYYPGQGARKPEGQ